MEYSCPACGRPVEANMDKLVASAEDARNILGRDISKVGVYCEHCKRVVMIELPKITDLRSTLC